MGTCMIVIQVLLANANPHATEITAGNTVTVGPPLLALGISKIQQALSGTVLHPPASSAKLKSHCRINSRGILKLLASLRHESAAPRGVCRFAVHLFA